MAIAGLITGLIAVVIAIIAIASISSAVDSLNNDLNKAKSAAGNPASFSQAQQRVDRQEHQLIRQGLFVGNQ